MATSSPRPLSFFTASGVAATRASPARRSLRMASFMDALVVRAPDQENCQQDDRADEHPFDELEKTEPGFHMLLVVEIGAGPVPGVIGHRCPQKRRFEAARTIAKPPLGATAQMARIQPRQSIQPP